MRNTDYILEKLREVARRTVRRGYQSIARSFDTRGLLAEERETFTSFSGVVLNRTTDYSYDAAGRTLGTYTDHLYYAEGSAEPRYTGCPTARETTIGGRYDYRYDAHDRLTAADYTPGTDAAADEDFSTVYTYDDAANPLSVRRYGVIGTEADGTEEFGIVDDLTFAYEGNQVQSIANAPEGEDFYGRTGYGAVEGESAYAWNDQGYMTADASRGITNIKYNHQGLPVQMRFSNGDMTVCSYDASGLLTKSVTIGRRSELRDYVADRVFSTGALLYSYFPGGYFDADGAPHYLHTDYQGSVVMVTDSAGTIEQHTSYYPYGEPHRSPAGQPILYGGKERLATTDDYNFDARRYHAPTLLMSAPDPCSGSSPHLSPFIYCAGNPLKYTDVTGRKFTAGAEVFVKRLTDEISARMFKLEKEIANINSQLSQDNLSLKERKRLDKKMTKATQKKDTYKGIREEINTLRKSNQLYDIRLDDSSSTPSNLYTNMGGEDKSSTSFDMENNSVLIKLSDNSLGMIAHELKHAYQFENGELNFGSGNILNDIHDEMEAIDRGELFGQVVTYNVYKEYKHLLMERVSLWDYPIECLNNPLFLQNRANRHKVIFRWHGVTYINEE